MCCPPETALIASLNAILFFFNIGSKKLAFLPCLSPNNSDLVSSELLQALVAMLGKLFSLLLHLKPDSKGNSRCSVFMTFVIAYLKFPIHPLLIKISVDIYCLLTQNHISPHTASLCLHLRKQNKRFDCCLSYLHSNNQKYTKMRKVSHAFFQSFSSCPNSCLVLEKQ